MIAILALYLVGILGCSAFHLGNIEGLERDVRRICHDPQACEIVGQRINGLVGNRGLLQACTPGNGAKESSNLYDVENHWGGSNDPWHPAGTWKMGSRDGSIQPLVAVNLKRAGPQLIGQITYKGEGPIDFQGCEVAGKPNIYYCQVKWGDSDWQDEGLWQIGDRSGQDVVDLNLSSSDGGKSLEGSMKYEREGPIAFRARRIPKVY